MYREKPQLTKKYIFILAAGLTIYLLFLYFFVDVQAIIASIQYADPLIYALAFLASVMNMFFHSLTWWRLLSSLSIKVPLRKIFSFIWIGSFVDILVPAESVSGEITRAYLISHYSEKDGGRSTASIMTHRVIYTTMSLIFFFVSSIIFTLTHELTLPILGVIVAIIVSASASLIFLCLLCIKRGLALKIVDSALGLLDFILRGRWNLVKFKPKIRVFLDAFYDGLRILVNRPTSFVWPIVFSVAAWIFKMLITFLVIISLNVEIHLSTIVVVFSIIDTLQTIPLGIPGEVGIIEIAMTGLYTALGIHPSISATITILTRVVTLWFNLFVGGVIVQWVGVKILKGEGSKS